MNMQTGHALDGYFARERETLATAPVLCAELRALGVTTVRATYDGAGDEGQIDDIRYLDDGDPEVDIPINNDLHQRIEALLYALLACRHGGWDQNDGAFGNFTWDLVEETFEHEHNDRVLTYITSVQMGFELAVEQEELP